MEPPSAVTEPTTTTTTTTTISRRRDRSARDLDTVREEANRLGVALEAARDEVERLTAALEAERAAVRTLRRERDRDLRAAREQEAARGRTALCDLRGRFERELDDAVRRAKEAAARELGAELNRALRERDAEARREAEAARAREEDLRAQLRVAVREAATATSQQHQHSNADNLEAELAALRARCRELEEKLRILAEADRRKAADLREQHEQHEAEMAALRKASQQETVRLLEELRSKDRAISQLGREANLQAGRAEESRGRLLDKQCQHCEERERRMMKRASDTRDKRQLLRKLREDDQNNNNNNKNHRRNADTTQEEEVNTTTTAPAVEHNLRLQLEEKEKIIAALQAAEQEKSKKLDQLTKRHRKEQMRHYYRQFMELEPVVEQEEDSGADSPSPSLSPQPSPVLWGTAEGSEYAALLRDHVELQGEYAALQAKRLRLEHELASARMHSRELRRMAAEHTGGGGGQSCADRMKTLQAEADDLREQNELLEFRILELEEYGNRDSHTSLRSPDTRDVWTDTESDSGIQSLSVEESPDLQEIDLEIKRQELKSRVLNLAATASNVEDRSCLQQVLALLENYEQRLEAEGRVLGSHLELGEHPSKISTRRIVAKVLPFTDLQEIPDVEDEEQGIRRQQLKNAECLQESGIFEESPTEFVTRGTQTEDSPYFPAGLLKCVGSVNELGEELRRLNEIRELVEERGRGDCEPLRITASHLKELAYCRERLQLLEDKVLIYESSGDQQTRLLSERLQREVKLSQQVKELSSKVARLEAENKRLEEERCELEEAENDTRLRCQKLETKLVALGERKSELQLQLTQEHREIDRLKSIMEENEQNRSKQMGYLESMISKYEQRNYELEERAMDLHTRIDLLESSLPAIIMFNMFQIMQNENVPRRELTSALSASLVKARSRTAQKSQPALLEKEWAMEHEMENFILPPKDGDTFMKKDSPMEQTSSCSELQCLRKLQDLIHSEAMLKKRIMELERKETVYMETLQQADALWSDMETNYKTQISKSEQNEALMREKVKQLTQCASQGEEALTERLAALEQSETRLLEQVRLLENDKNNLGKQLEEARIAFETCSSELEALKGNVEGPLKTELSKERSNCRELLRTLEEKEQEIQKSVDQSKTEIHGLKMQLKKAYRELVDSECTCSELKEEVETLEMKVSELKMSLEEQKQKEELLMIQLSQAILKKEELEKTKQVSLANTTLQDELKEVQMLRHPESSKGGKFSGASTDGTAASKVGVISLNKGKSDDLEKDYLWTKYIKDPSRLDLEELEETTTVQDFASDFSKKHSASKVEIITPSSVLCYKAEISPSSKLSTKVPTKTDEEDFWANFYSDPCSKKVEDDFVEAAFKAGYHHPREGRKAASAVLVYLAGTGCPGSCSAGGQAQQSEAPPQQPNLLPVGQCKVKCHDQCSCHPGEDGGHPGGDEHSEWTRHIGNPCTQELDEDLDELAQMAGFTRPFSDAAASSGGAGAEGLLPKGQCKVKCTPNCACHSGPGGEEHSEWTKHIGNPCTQELDEDLDELAQMAGFTRPGSDPQSGGAALPAGQCKVKCHDGCVCHTQPGSDAAGSLLPAGQCKEKCTADCACHGEGGEAAHPGGDGPSEWTRHIGNPCTQELDEDLDELAQMAGFTRPFSDAAKAGSAAAGNLLPVGQCKEKCTADCACHGGGAEGHPGGEEHSEWTRHIGNPCTQELDEDLDELAQMAGFTRPFSDAAKAGSAAAGNLLPVGQCKEKCTADCACHGGGAEGHPGGEEHSEWTRHIGNPCTQELDEDLDELAQMAGFTRPFSDAAKAGSAAAGNLLPVGQCKEKCTADCACHGGGAEGHPGGEEHSEWTRHIGNPCTQELDEDLDELAQMAGFTRPFSDAAKPGGALPVGQCKEKCNAECQCHDEKAGSAAAGSLLPAGQCKEKCTADCACHGEGHPGGEEHSEWTRHIGNPCTQELDEDLDELAQMAGFTRPFSDAAKAGSAAAGSLLPAGQCKEKCTADCACHEGGAGGAGGAGHPGGEEHSEWTRHIGNPCTQELDEDLDELAQMAGFTRPFSDAAKPGSTAPCGGKCNADCVCDKASPTSGGAPPPPPPPPPPMPAGEGSEWTRHIGNPCTQELDEDLDELAQMAGFTRPFSDAAASSTEGGTAGSKCNKCKNDCTCISTGGDALSGRFSFESAYERVSAEDFQFGEQGSMVLSPMASLVKFTDSELAAAFDESPVFPGDEQEAQAAPAATPRSAGTRKLLPRGTCKKKCRASCNCGQSAPTSDSQKCKAKCTGGCVCADKTGGDALSGRFSFESAYERVSAEDFPFGEQGSMVLSPMASLIKFTDSQLDAAFDESPVFPPEEGEGGTFMLEESYDDKGGARGPGGADVPGAGAASACRVFCWSEESGLVPIPAAVDDPTTEECKVFCWEPEEAAGGAPPAKGGEDAPDGGKAAAEEAGGAKGTGGEAPGGEQCVCPEGGAEGTPASEQPPPDAKAQDSGCQVFCWEGEGESAPAGGQGAVKEISVEITIEEKPEGGSKADDENCVCTEAEGAKGAGAGPDGTVPSKESSCGVFCWAGPSQPGAVPGSFSPCSSVFCWEGHPPPPVNFGAAEAPGEESGDEFHDVQEEPQGKAATTAEEASSEEVATSSVTDEESKVETDLEEEEYVTEEEEEFIGSEEETESVESEIYEEEAYTTPEAGESETPDEQELSSTEEEAPTVAETESPDEQQALVEDEEAPTPQETVEVPEDQQPSAEEEEPPVPPETAEVPEDQQPSAEEEEPPVPPETVEVPEDQQPSAEGEEPPVPPETVEGETPEDQQPSAEGEEPPVPPETVEVPEDQQPSAEGEEPPVPPETVEGETPPTEGEEPPVPPETVEGETPEDQQPSAEGEEPPVPPETVEGETPEDQQPPTEGEVAPPLPETVEETAEEQQPPLEEEKAPTAQIPSVTGISSTSAQHFMTDLQEKCRVKDKMISALANELQLRARSHVWKNLLSDLDSVDSPTEPPCDFDEEMLCRYLRKPSDSIMGRSPQRILSAPVASKPQTDSTPTLLVEVKPRFKRKDTSQTREQTADLQEPSTARSARSASDLAIKPHGLHVIRQLEPDSLLLGWNGSPNSSLSGFEIYINGVFVHKVHSPTRNKALIRNVNMSSKMVISLYAITPTGRSSEPACVVHEIKQ